VRQPRQSQTRRHATFSACVLSTWLKAFAIGMPFAGAADASWIVASDIPAIINSAINNLLIILSRE
jgi:hypothetical protein